MKTNKYSAVQKFFLALLIAAASSGVSLSQDFKPVRDGVDLAEVRVRLADNEPAKIALLRLDPAKVRLDVLHAFDRSIGTERTSSIAKRHGAVAAVNAGFFRLDGSIFAGDAAGILKIDGKILSESSNGRIAALIENGAERTAISFAHLDLTGTLTVGLRTLRLSGINRERKADELLIFTPEFDRSTLTDPAGVEVIVSKGRILQIADGSGSSVIPADGFIISASGKRREELLRYVRSGTRASFDFSAEAPTTNPARWLPKFAAAEDVVNGVPELIRDGKATITWQLEKAAKAFAENRHPRTAIGKFSDGRILLMTVDGRQPGVSAGMTLKELTEYLLGIGIVDAMNLDGGGSTTMVVDGRVVNVPSDKEGERRVSDALVVTMRETTRPRK